MDEPQNQIRQTLRVSDPLLLRCGDRTAISACSLFQEFQACRHDPIMFGLQFLQRFRTHPHLGLLMVFETSPRRDEVRVRAEALQELKAEHDRIMAARLELLKEGAGGDGSAVPATQQ